VNQHGEHSGIAGDVDCPQHRIAQQCLTDAPIVLW